MGRLHFNKTQIKLNDIRRILHWSILCLALLLLGVGCHSLGGDSATPLGEGEPSSIEDSVNASSEELDKDNEENHEEADNNTDGADNGDKVENLDSQENQENNKDREAGIIRVIIQTEVLNVRQEPSTESSIVGKALCGEDYDIQDQVVDKSGDTWYQIDKGEEGLGWVDADYVYGANTYGQDIYGRYYSRRIPYDVIEEGYIYQDDTLYVTTWGSRAGHEFKDRLHLYYQYVEKSDWVEDGWVEGAKLYRNEYAEGAVEDILNDTTRFVHQHKVYKMKEYNALANLIQEPFYTMDYSDKYYVYLDVASNLHLVDRSTKTEITWIQDEIDSFRVIEEGVLYSTHEGSFAYMNNMGRWVNQKLTSKMGQQFTYVDGVFWIYTYRSGLIAKKGDMSRTWEDIGVCILTQDGAYQVQDGILEKLDYDTSIATYISPIYILYANEVDNIWEDNGKIYIANSDDGDIKQVVEMDARKENLSNIIYENEEGALFYYGTVGYDTLTLLFYYNKQNHYVKLLYYSAYGVKVMEMDQKIYLAKHDRDTTEIICIDMATGNYQKMANVKGRVMNFNMSDPKAVAIDDEVKQMLRIYDVKGNCLDEIEYSEILTIYEDIIIYTDVNHKNQIYVYDKVKESNLRSHMKDFLGRDLYDSKNNSIERYRIDQYFYYINPEHVLERLNLTTGENIVLFEVDRILDTDGSQTPYLLAKTLDDEVIAWKYAVDSPVDVIHIEKVQKGKSTRYYGEIAGQYYGSVQDNSVRVKDIETGEIVFEKKVDPKRLYSIELTKDEIGIKLTIESGSLKYRGPSVPLKSEYYYVK